MYQTFYFLVQMYNSTFSFFEKHKHLCTVPPTAVGGGGGRVHLHLLLPLLLLLLLLSGTVLLVPDLLHLGRELLGRYGYGQGGGHLVVVHHPQVVACARHNHCVAVVD